MQKHRGFIGKLGPAGLVRACAVLWFSMNVSLVAATTADAAAKGLAVAQAADKQDEGWLDSTSNLTMLLKNRDGDTTTRKLRVRSLEGTTDGDQSLTVFDAPGDVRGTALLTWSHKTEDDDQWLFLPAIKRVKRITSNNQSGPFMGSEFSFEDLSSQEVEKYTYLYLREEACPHLAGQCHLLERKPVNKSSGYRRQLVWLDQVAYRVDQVDYYDRKDSLLKRLSNRQYTQYKDRFWRPLESQMENLQTGKQTLLTWDEIQFGVGVNASDFNADALSRVR